MITLTNLNAMRSAAAMADSNADIKTSMERLSTGSRINSASDDAAGLAISVRMDTQILGLSKSIANAADAIGLLGTADGALNEVTELLQRMRELSLRAANGAVTSTDRTHVNDEYQRLKDEIDRIGFQTQWNGMNIFDGIAFPGITEFQVGANAGQTIGVEIGVLSTSTIVDAPWELLGSSIEAEASADQSGRSVSLSGDGSVVAIGTPFNDGNGTNSGHTRLYKYDDLTDSWSQLGPDIDGEAANDYSGLSVSLSSDGSTVVIGAPGELGGQPTSSTINTAGHARVYRYDASSGMWIQLGADIDGEAAGDQSGFSVSISGDGNTIAIGAVDNDGNGNQSGHTRIYSYNSSSASWVQLGGDIDGESADSLAGSSVSLSQDGRTIAIGALGNSGGGSNSGHTRIYEYDESSGSWNQRGSDIDGDQSDHSGNSVSLSGDGNTLAIGSRYSDNNGSDSGLARVFKYDSSTSDWIQVGSDIEGEAAGDLAGYSVSLSRDGSSLAVGAIRNDSGGNNSGHTRIYSYQNDSTGWVLEGAAIDGEGANDASGTSVALSEDGSKLAIGEPGGDPNGQVRLYKRESLNHTKLTSVSNAQAAIGIVDQAINNVSIMKARYGATTNRLTHAIDNLTNGLLNSQSSRSGISDADYAKESSNLASAQIRNQGAKAMLAQANTDQELTFKLIEDWL